MNKMSHVCYFVKIRIPRELIHLISVQSGQEFLSIVELNQVQRLRFLYIFF